MSNGVAAIVTLPGSGDEAHQKNPLQRQWLADLPQPWWLLNDMKEDVWWVTDSSQQKPKCIKWGYTFADGNGQVFILTDEENSHLLETIQLTCYYLREGHLATSESAEKQVVCASSLFSLAAWMRLNQVFRFTQLTALDFEKYRKECVYGKACLLDGPNRLGSLLESYKKSGLELPSKTHHFKKKEVDVACIGRTIGYETIAKENVLLGQLYLRAKEEGFYLSVYQKRLLKSCCLEKSVKNPDTIRTALMPWKRLWDLRTELKDTIHFDPFDGIPVRVLAKTTIKEIENEEEDTFTEIIPELQAAFLIDRAIRWVVNYSEDLLILRDKHEEVCQEQDLKSPKELPKRRRRLEIKNSMNKILSSYRAIGFVQDSPDYPAQPWPLGAEVHYEESYTYTRLGLSAALNHLMVACAIVICAFTSRRHEEVMKIYDNSPEVGDPRKPAIETDDEGDWLWCWIEKSVRAWDRTPCPRVVTCAVNVLHALSESARSMTGSRELFQRKVVGSQEVFMMTAFNRHLKKFGEFVEVPPLEDGSYWHFTTKQFRKFFAVLYMFGYEHGNLSALSHHMRHSDLQTTEDYCLKRSNETTLSKMRKHHATGLMIDVTVGKRNPAGKGGEILSELLVKLLKQALMHTEIIPSTYKPEAARRIAERVMRKLELTMVPFKWGYCTSFRKLTSFHGACAEGGGGFDQGNTDNLLQMQSLLH